MENRQFHTPVPVAFMFTHERGGLVAAEGGGVAATPWPRGDAGEKASRRLHARPSPRHRRDLRPFKNDDVAALMIQNQWHAWNARRFMQDAIRTRYTVKTDPLTGRLMRVRRADYFSHESRRHRGRDVDIPWETRRGDAAGAEWIVRGDDEQAKACSRGEGQQIVSARIDFAAAAT